MDLIKQILEITQKGINEPQDLILLIFASITFIYSLVIKFHKINSLNDFDRILLPKNERSVQQILVRITDYFIFSFLYSISGFSLFVIVSKIADSLIGLWIFTVILGLFILTLLPILIRMLIVEMFGRENAERFQWFKRFYEFKFVDFSFHINFFSTFLIYAFLFYYFVFANVNNVGAGLLFLLLFPMLILYLYRSYRNKSIHEYNCNIISEQDFNSAMLIIHYTLDKDRIIFRKPNDIDNQEIFMYDRSADKYFKFTRVNII